MVLQGIISPVRRVFSIYQSRLAEIRQHRVDELKSSEQYVSMRISRHFQSRNSLVDLLANLGTSEDNLPAHKDQEDDLRLHHAIDQTRKQLRFVRREVVMATSQTFKTNWEFDVARPDNVLDLEICKLGIEAELLNNTGVFATRQSAIVFRFRASHNHLARSEDQSGRLRFTNTHDDSSETLQGQVQLKKKKKKAGGASQYLWVVLGIACMQSNRLEIKPAVKIDGCDNISLGMHFRTPLSSMRISGNTYCKVGIMPLAEF